MWPAGRTCTTDVDNYCAMTLIPVISTVFKNVLILICGDYLSRPTVIMLVVTNVTFNSDLILDWAVLKQYLP